MHVRRWLARLLASLFAVRPADRGRATTVLALLVAGLVAATGAAAHASQRGAGVGGRAAALDAPGRDSMTFGARTASAERFELAGSGLVRAVGAVSIQGLSIPRADAALIDAAGAPRALRYSASGAVIELADLQPVAGGFSARSVSVTPPAAWGSAPVTSPGAVQISAAGLSGAIALPDVLLGGDGRAVVTGLRAHIVAGARGYQLAVDGARLRVRLSDAVSEAAISGSFDATGAFVGSAGRLDLDLAGARLQLERVAVAGGAIRGESARLRLPDSMGGWESAPIAGVVFDRGGLRLGAENRVAFPGARVGMRVQDGYQMSEIVGSVRPAGAGRAANLVLSGPVKVEVLSEATTTQGTITLRGSGITTAQLATFKVPLAGLSLLLPGSAVDAEGFIRVQQAELKAPEAAGGIGVTVYNVVFNTRTSELSIGGGEFKLPLLKFDGFKLGLGGKLIRTQGASGVTYEIGANGVFEIDAAGKPPVGCTGIEIDVQIAATFANSARIDIRPSAELMAMNQAVIEYGYNEKVFNALSDFQLKNAALKLSCKIPIPETTFSIAGVSGSISLSREKAEIELGAAIENDFTLPLVGSVLRFEGAVRYGVYPAIRYGLAGKVKVFTLEALDAGGSIEYNYVTNTPRFNAHIQLQNIIMRGRAEVNVWALPSRQFCWWGGCVNVAGDFYFTIRGRVDVGFQRGSWGFLGLPWWDVNLASADVQGGRFKNGRWGFRADASFMWWKVGAYVDQNNRLIINPGDDYTLATPPGLQRAKQRWRAALNNGASLQAAQALDLRYSFTPEGTVINMVNEVDQPLITRTSELMFTLVHSDTVDGKLSVIGPDGTEYTRDNAASFPNLVNFTSSTTATVGSVVEIFRVQRAEPGANVWKAKISLPDGVSFAPMVAYARPLPMTFGEPTVGKGGDSATLNWKASSSYPVTVTAYLTNITGRAGISDEQIISDSVRLYSVPSRIDGSTSTATLDLRTVPSGSYRVSYQAEDDFNPPVQALAPQTLVVDNSASWPAAWTPTITVTNGFQDADVEWSELAHPDLNEYLVYISDAPGHAAPAYVDAPAMLDASGEELSFTEVFTNGLSTFTGFEGFSAGETYYVAIGARDGDGKIALSPEAQIRPKTAPFSFSAAKNSLTIPAGGSASVDLTLRTDLSPYPGEVGLYNGCLDDLPDNYVVQLPLVTAGNTTGARGPTACTAETGIELYLDNVDTDVFTPTLGGINLTLTAEVPETLAPGTYYVPVEAWGGGEQRIVPLTITVTAPGELRQTAPAATQRKRI